MKAFILAAGLGTRLAPLTHERAKPALPLGGEPLLARVLRQVADAGIVDIRVNSHHRPKSIESVINRHTPPGTRVSIQYEPALLGTGGALFESRDWIGEEPLLIVNGDAVSDIDYRELIGTHRAGTSVATMALRTPSPRQQFGRVEINAQGKVVRILEDGPQLKETVSRMFCGIHIVDARFMGLLEPKGFSCVVRRGYLRALRSGLSIQSYEHDGFFADAGTPSRFLDAHWHILRTKSLSDDEQHGASVNFDRVIWVERDVSVGEDVTMGDCVYLGRGSVVGRGARLCDVIVEAGGTIQAGEELSGAIRLASGVTAFRDPP